MRLLFLPYKPSKDVQLDGDAPEISPQKHAAREHHRKAKLLRQEARNSRNLLGSDDEKGALASSLESLGATRTLTGTHIQWEPDNYGDKEFPKDGPRSLLGAGRLDPFDIYCVPKQPLIVHEILDHAISYQWSLFAANETPDSLNVVKNSLMNLAMRSPLFFNTLIYAGATHKAFFQSPTVNNARSAVLRLDRKGEVLRALQASLQSPETASTDEVIFAMTIMTILGSGEKVTAVEREKREDRVLAAGQDAQFYASMEYEWRHMKALREIVRMKGGLHTICLPGLAIAIASFDIHTAMMYQTRPTFPLFLPSSLVLKSWPTSQPGSPASQLSPALITGFDFLSTSSLPVATELLDVLQGMRNIILGFDSHQRGGSEAPGIKPIIFARNLNQHELMSLPDLSVQLYSEDVALRDQRKQQDTAVYELCRLGAIIFQIIVLLPNLHEPTEVTEPYAERMIRCLKHATELDLYQNPTYHDLLLWVATLCAWLCKATKTRGWFIDLLIWHGSVLKGQYECADTSWQTVKRSLVKFLWLESECEVPCRAIWEEAEASQIPNEQCVVC